MLKKEGEGEGEELVQGVIEGSLEDDVGIEGGTTVMRRIGAFSMLG